MSADEHQPIRRPDVKLTFRTRVLFFAFQLILISVLLTFDSEYYCNADNHLDDIVEFCESKLYHEVSKLVEISRDTRRF